MTDKEFDKRVSGLRINPEMIEKIVVEIPGQEPYVIPNEPGKQKSLQIYAAITKYDSTITPKEAQEGLDIFGLPLIAETATHPGMHRSIEVLNQIRSSGKSARCYVHRVPNAKPLPATYRDLESIAEKFGTPFILYDAAGAKDTLRTIKSAFSWNSGFREYFAVKSAPNPHLLEFMRFEGAGADCSSDPELYLSEAVGMSGEELFFSSNNTPGKEFVHADKAGAIINFDDLTHLDFFMKNIGHRLPEIGCVRYNPGEERTGNSIIGNPIDAKYGLTREQVYQAFERMREMGVRRFGLHTMVASNSLNPQYHIDTAKMLFNLSVDIKRKLGIGVEFVNLGGGWGVNYKPEQIQINPHEISQGIREAYKEIIAKNNLGPVKIFMENGRFVTGPNGILVSRVIHEKHIYKEYLGVDATMADFMRPAIYDIYQHAQIAGKEHLPKDHVYDVVGSLCENSDKFAVNRPLPKTEIGDLFVLHDAGAHGRAMGFNYNAKLRCQELLLHSDGNVEMIRRPETRQDYFATLDFPGSRFSNLSK